jgi:hypothetical protein
MASDIASKENQLWPLRLLLTQKECYGRAKGALGIQVAVAVVVPATFLLVQQRYPGVKVWIALYGLGVAILDVAVLEPLKTSLRRKGALLQELFDCEVLSLPWSELSAGRKPDPEDVLTVSESDPRLLPLHNWYSVGVSNVPQFIGRVICQRSNCWWDSKLRRAYRFLPLSSAILLIAIVTVVAVAQRTTLTDFVLGFVAPALPIVLWGIREARAQAEAADRADRLKSFGDTLWSRILRGELTPDTAGTFRENSRTRSLHIVARVHLSSTGSTTSRRPATSSRWVPASTEWSPKLGMQGFDDPTHSGTNRA